MPQFSCRKCGRTGSRSFIDHGDGPECTNADQCAKRIGAAERAKLADRCVDCLESGDDPKGTRKLALKDDGSRQPGPRCVTHWRARRKTVSAAAHERRLDGEFDLTPELYWAIYEAQGCKCFICRKSTGKARRLAVDHDHLLALEHGHDPKKGCRRCIRALLCKRCNTLVGWLDVEALKRAIILLTDPPARPILCPPDRHIEVNVEIDEAITCEIPDGPVECTSDDFWDTGEPVDAGDFWAAEADATGNFWLDPV